MYTAQPNGADSATINPAALKSSDVVNPGSRGIKRSRSPDNKAEATQPGSAGDDGDSHPNKRGRSMKSRPSGGVPEAPSQAPVSTIPQAIPPPQTPQSQNAPLPGQATYAPTQASPQPKTTPTKSTLKALPTVRDHTTDQLSPSGDEYIPREIDEFGEKKVLPNGQLLGGREYRCRTFLVPHRGDKLFMLATECARVLGYRDSYLLFNKNRSLYKIIASQVEKDDLVSQEILPFSYRSRQIAIVTARSMFRQFGSRVIVNGRRVRDDYWETKARKQGFTEADPAGEKRPGAAKAREAAAEAAAQQNSGGNVIIGAQTEIVYQHPAGQFPGAPQPPMIPQPDLNDTRSRGDYSGILKGGPRQEITGPAYQDQTRPTPIQEIHAQAHHTAEFNRSVNQQRDMRNDYIQSMWRRPHEQPASSSLSQPVATSETTIPTSRPSQSPHTTTAGMPQSSGIVPTQSPQIMMTTPPYSQTIHAQNPISQTPMRGTTGSMPQAAAQGYNYPPSNPMWQQQAAAAQTPQHGYSGYTTQGQQPSHPQQSSAPHLRQSTSGQVQPGMPFSGMTGLSQGYGSQGMYADQTPRQYMAPNPQAGPASTQAWSSQQAPTQWWTNQPQ